MRTREIAEHETVSAWFSAATAHPETATALWHENPHLPRRLGCGLTFDIVLSDRSLIEAAYRLLDQYEQPLGPAVLFSNLRHAAVLVPRGTGAGWYGLMAASQWPERLPRPACLGEGHAILVPALVPRPTFGLVRWLVPPDGEQSVGGVPLLTSPVPLARCLSEAGALLAPVERTPLSRAVSAFRSVLPSSSVPSVLPSPKRT
ncbi:hypothetical protein ACKI1S_16725 [Streptomyces galilaeus]|uniref:DNA primase/polymerase bifunctional N-terminal domain-containing protein n=1 Tax=Streptomyces galilaeus TaxID=33899 RepID=A0ABW9IL77_STRGJ